ncbi:26S proteasome non-ATPase regulatory subunit 4 isoform X1 [Tribolium castaneum]|uniref:26S proteasome non-ATPase regulatory subunit 4 isoform X1 n=1 Tax=Tribolium castaneum TaxID=7070 RepID=UPI00046C0542|nr:PREDICTED: 26S proteasome non-ATPase regulatory subunit 4 isoform X1 [Tribolium castaneum]|eukprot:XP_008198942.1 PREDICTED: 26S proteasome non-ATPase regulatory subunit 4 isoform X1 [Tribolium castaneum]
MVLESTMICVDNSDYMRNGDFLPTRLQAQQDAVNLVCHSKTRSNPENNVGLLTLANVEVLATLTSDVGRILSKLHQVQPNGDINLHTGIRIAHLALKHRQGKNHKMRIVAFVGSPVASEEKELVKLAKKLKKEKVNVDIVSFGEDFTNNEVLTTFINTLNGKSLKDGSSSHLVTVPPGPHLSDALISSPIIQGEDGTGGAGLGASGFEFGVDPNEDPELALALRVSMEEQRQRQEDEARRAKEASSTETGAKTSPIKEEPSEEAMLERALAMSMEEDGESAPAGVPTVDFANMTEDEQIAFAMQMSMQDAQESSSGKKEEPMEVEGDEDYSEVMNDPAFLQSVLENLPGVDPQSEAVRQAVGNLKDKKKEDKEDKQKK